MKKSLRFFSEPADTLKCKNRNRLLAYLRPGGTIAGFLALALHASTASGQGNTSYGTGALSSNTNGFYNTAIGFNTLFSNTSGSQNTAVGFNALYRNVNGIDNTVNGANAMYSNTFGTGNTVNGANAMYSNILGDNNTVNGANAMYSNTFGTNNVANGSGALYANTTGDHNTATGAYALYTSKAGSYNTANGAYALYANTTGVYNTATGAESLFSNTTGNNNSASGYHALFSNTTGRDNTAAGFLSLYTNTTGINNVANGAKALYLNTGGNNNAANGFAALYSNTTGSNNIATGTQSLVSNTTGSNNVANGVIALYNNTAGSNNVADGVTALYSNTTGNFNLGNGYHALYYNITGTGNTGLGAEADVIAGNLNNATAIGYGAVADASNKVRVGNTSVTSIGGQVGWTTFSDGRYKKNIRENVTGLAFINSLRPVTYTVNVAGLNEYFNRDRKQPQPATDDNISVALPKAGEDSAAAKAAEATEEAGKIVYDGFIAQEVEEAAARLGIPFSGVDKPKSKDGLYGLRYDNFVVPLVKAVQELSKQNDEKEAKIDALQSQLDAQQKQLDELKALVLAKGQATDGSPSSASAVLAGAFLEQNTPNPFDRVTTIAYTLPQYYTRAQIVISDQSGRMLRQVNISGSGKGTLKVDGGTLAAGTYTYSLLVDGKIISARRMVLTR